jgi:hypothetical protein
MTVAPARMPGLSFLQRGNPMKITFLRNFKPAGNSPLIPSYGKGQTYDFDGGVAEGYAAKYIRLGYAEEAVQKRPGPVHYTMPASVPDTVILGDATVYSTGMAGPVPAVETSQRPRTFGKRHR